MNWYKDRTIPLSEKWLNKLKKDLDESYIKHAEPWKQAGFNMDEKAWELLRKPIAELIDKSGSFLDISCSNGYLLECLIKWADERGHQITPFGLDLSAKLIDLAKKRLTEHEDNFVIGCATEWVSPIKFDFVRTELSYVLIENQEKYLNTLFSTFIKEDGKLILTEYRTKKQNHKEPWTTDKLRNWEFEVIDQVSAVYENRELLRAVVVMRKSDSLANPAE